MNQIIMNEITWSQIIMAFMVRPLKCKPLVLYGSAKVRHVSMMLNPTSRIMKVYGENMPALPQKA